MNRFLLCTLVCGAAREINARATQDGTGATVTMIARNVLRSCLMVASDRLDSPSEPEQGILSLNMDLGHLNEESLWAAIERQLQAVLIQSQAHRAEEKRLDIESILAAVEARRKR